MLYLCIPVYNEAPTVGLVLWRIRKVFQEYSREYEIIVYNDGSTDGTLDAVDAYKKVLPLVIGSESREGYSRALDALARTVSARTRYPRRDAMILMQGDFADQPDHLPRASSSGLRAGRTSSSVSAGRHVRLRSRSVDCDGWLGGSLDRSSPCRESPTHSGRSASTASRSFAIC